MQSILVQCWWKKPDWTHVTLIQTRVHVSSFQSKRVPTEVMNSHKSPHLLSCEQQRQKLPLKKRWNCLFSAFCWQLQLLHLGSDPRYLILLDVETSRLAWDPRLRMTILWLLTIFAWVTMSVHHFSPWLQGKAQLFSIFFTDMRTHSNLDIWGRNSHISSRGQV